MNMIQSFNQTINYLETVLIDEIDEQKIAYLSGYSYPMFSRLFSILTEMTLSDYIRSRKLTQAAIDLRDTNQKIIDIAMMYGYESSDSFGTAFKNFHGFTPSEVRKGRPFRLVSRVQLALSIKGGRNMTIRIEQKDVFTVAGINENNITSERCPSVWKKLYGHYSHEQLTALGNGQSIGVCHDIEDPSTINYMAAYIINDRDKAEKMGLTILDVAPAEYAVIDLKGSVPDCIHEGWKYALEVFLPEHGYVHSGAPDFEYYYEGDMDSPDYQMELWIPIVKGE